MDIIRQLSYLYAVFLTGVSTFAFLSVYLFNRQISADGTCKVLLFGNLLTVICILINGRPYVRNIIKILTSSMKLCFTFLFLCSLFLIIFNITKFSIFDHVYLAVLTIISWGICSLITRKIEKR